MAPRSTDLKFTRPFQRIFLMIIFLAIVGGVGYLLYGQIRLVFLANPLLNGLIGFVFVVGVIVAFWHVFRLFSAVGWIEALAARTRGIEHVRPPSLLVAMDPLRKSGGRLALASGTGRSILDSVATRIDESRDILRYVSGLLIFLGLLGTFWGLANTVPAVVDTIRAITPQPGEDGSAVFQRLMSGLEDQLGGMGAAFSSSLLGLAGSLVVGFLELMSAGGQNRFYNELEAWLSQMTRITAVGEDEGSGAMSGNLADQMSFSTQQLEALNRIMAASEERRAEDSAQIAAAVANIERLTTQSLADRESLEQAMATQVRVAETLERLVGLGGLGGGAVEGAGMDAETRRHIRNIDVLLARLIEEAAAGRQETADALRKEMRAVSRAVGKMSSAIGGDPAV